MPTTLSIETKLKDGLALRGMSTEEFARLAKFEGIPNSSRATLNKAFQDENAIPLRNEVALKLLSLWGELETMIHESYVKTPWAAMDLSSGARIHTSLQIFRGLRALCGQEENSSAEEKQR